MDSAQLQSPGIEVLQSWGIATARHFSGRVVCPPSSSSDPSSSSTTSTDNTTEHLYDVPLGPSVVRWDLTTSKRLLQFQAHSDLIMSVRNSPDGCYVASSAYSGGVKLWSREWACLDSVSAPMESQFYLAWSRDSSKLLIIGNGWRSSIVVYNVHKEQSGAKLEQAWVLRATDNTKPPTSGSAGGLGDETGQQARGGEETAKDTVSTKPPTSGSAGGLGAETSQQARGEEETAKKTVSSPNGTVNSGEKSASSSDVSSTKDTNSDTKKTAHSAAESSRNYPYEEAFYMAEFNPSGNIFAVREVPYKTTLIQLVSPGGRILKTVDLMALVGDGKERPVNTLFISAFHRGAYAIGLEGGRIAIMDAESLHLKKVFKVGSGFRTGLWDGDCLVLPSDSGKVMWWSVDGEKVAEFESCFQDYVMHMDWSVSGKAIWICGFSCLLLLSVDWDDEGKVRSVAPSMMVKGHELTSVGVGFDPSGRRIASGDMVGNVWVTDREKVLPQYKFEVGGSVRCLTWVSERCVIVGTLDGGLYLWQEGHAPPRLLVQRQGSVIHMQLDQAHKHVAVGTSKGILAVYEVTDLEGEGAKCGAMVEFSAHPPQPGSQDQRFGQLGEQAEIWSLCWSPDDDKLATCSEDQTVKVWDTGSWKSVAVLRGHSLAVTSVDWRKHGERSLLASCSDDRTVRLVCGETYRLLSVVNTKDIYGWHTLTYLSFYPQKDSCLLLCTTQNGHLVMWKVVNDHHEGASGPLERLWKGKVHLGSIEGLGWQDREGGGSVVTVGADCIVNLLEISLKQ